MIRTTAGEAGQAGIDLDVAMDEPVFVFAASDPVAAASCSPATRCS